VLASGVVVAIGFASAVAPDAMRSCNNEFDTAAAFARDYSDERRPEVCARAVARVFEWN